MRAAYDSCEDDKTSADDDWTALIKKRDTETDDLELVEYYEARQKAAGNLCDETIIQCTKLFTSLEVLEE